MKYIPADKLIAELTKMQFDLNAAYRHPQSDSIVRAISLEYDDILSLVDSLQQDEKAVELDMCSQAYWEERGWMMIPPDVTLKGIESLLEQVRKKLQQEHPQIADASKMDEVDLEKAFAHEYAIYHLPNFIIASIADGTELIDFIYKTARHFAEWGAEHARKEE